MLDTDDEPLVSDPDRKMLSAWGVVDEKGKIAVAQYTVNARFSEVVPQQAKGPSAL